MEKNEEMRKEEMMGGDDPLRKGVGRMTCLAKVSTWEDVSGCVLRSIPDTAIGH